MLETENTTHNPSSEQQSFDILTMDPKESLVLASKCKTDWAHPLSLIHPSFRVFLGKDKNGIFIDSRLTLYCLKKAVKKICSIFSHGNTSALFVATKENIADVVSNYANRCFQYRVAKKWIGGTLTNYQNTIEKAMTSLETDKENTEEDDVKTKKERMQAERRRNKAMERLGGFAGDEYKKPMFKSMPKVVIIVDPAHEITAVKEVLAMRERSSEKISMIVLGDGFHTNLFGIKRAKKITQKTFDTRLLDPRYDVFVPANDDAAASVELFCVLISNAILDSMKAAEDRKSEANSAPAKNTEPVSDLEKPQE